MILNKKYTDFEFKFKNLKECSNREYTNKYITFNGKNNINFMEHLQNGIETFNGLNINAIKDYYNITHNYIVILPGHCIVTNIDTGYAKIHKLFKQKCIRYNDENLLDDGSEVITGAGWCYIYSLYNNDSNEMIIKFSSVAPTRDKYNKIPIHYARTTMYHPILNARCIGTIPVGQYHNSSINDAEYWGDGTFQNCFISGNKLCFTRSNLVYTGTYTGTYYNYSNYHNPPSRIGGFPVTAYGCDSTVGYQTFVRIENNDAVSQELKRDNILYRASTTVNQVDTLYDSYNSDIFYFVTNKDLQFMKGDYNPETKYRNRIVRIINIYINR